MIADTNPINWGVKKDGSVVLFDWERISSGSEGRMEEKGELDHYIGVATSGDETAEFDVLKIDASTWAVFESIGPFPETLQNVWGRIYSEWFPSSGYEVVEGPEILWNESPDTGNSKYRSEIWVPVKKKDIK